MTTPENIPETAGAEIRVADLWTWLGRSQAFGLIGKKCSAAQAHCLKQIRDLELYKLIGLTWDEFCKQYLGLDRTNIDRIIRRLEEFGDAYFRLAEIMRISTETYRRIADTGVLHDDAIEIDGEAVPLVKENGPRIRAAILALRHDLDQARARKTRPLFPSVTSLSRRFDDWIRDIQIIANHSKDAGEIAGARGLVNGGINDLKKLLQEFPQLRWS